MATVRSSRITLRSGISVFYRHAGSPKSPTLLLLHGYPSSSHQFRNLIPLLADEYHVIAPDYPGFGFTTVPTTTNFEYTFNDISVVMLQFLLELGIKQYSMFIFDYGAPVGFRMALKKPAAVTAIITQNGNLFEEGLGEAFWAPIKRCWASNALEDREALRAAFTLDQVRQQYVCNDRNSELVSPESYHLDWSLLQRPGVQDAMLDLFKDYGNNVLEYPKWQKWLRESGVPVLVIWGDSDHIFVPAGAEKYREMLGDKKCEFHWLEGAGHFAIETRNEKVADRIRVFLDRIGVHSNGSMA